MTGAGGPGGFVRDPDSPIDELRISETGQHFRYRSDSFRHWIHPHQLRAEAQLSVRWITNGVQTVRYPQQT